MSSEMQRWNLFMPVELLEKVKIVAKKQHVSSSDVVRKALMTYISAIEKAQQPKQTTTEPANVV